MSRLRAATTPLRELVEVGACAAPHSNPERLLDEFLAPARDPEAPPTSRIEAYRLLLLALEGNLWDHEFAATLHREWMSCGVRRTGLAVESRSGDRRAGFAVEGRGGDR